MTSYTALVGRSVARWLTDPGRGPLSPGGFYRSGAEGLVADLGEGWVLIDEPALDALRGLPPDRDGHVTDEDGPVLWIGNDGYPLTPQAGP